MQEAVGKQVAGTLAEIKVRTPSTNRTPCGPSVTVISGIPRRSTGVVVQGPSPVHRAAFSSRDIFLIKSVIFVMDKSFLYGWVYWQEIRSEIYDGRDQRNSFKFK